MRLIYLNNGFISRLRFMVTALVLLISMQALAQTPPPFPCDGSFLFTRQYPAGSTNITNSYISRVDFVPGDIDLSNPGTIGNTGGGTGGVLVNASVFYGGYIYTQRWNAASFTLLKIGADFTYTEITIAGMPTTSFNNFGITKNGIGYILSNSNPVTIYAIDFNLPSPALITGFPRQVLGIDPLSPVTWGDIAQDPVTNRIYAWFHPSGAIAANPAGLYELTFPAAGPTVSLIGAASITLGSLFFNDRGQMFGYGAASIGTTQDRIYAVDKASGAFTQYGVPDITVSQSDGSNCAFRISLDRQVSTPFLTLPKCGIDTVNYIFTIRNFTLQNSANIAFGDTLDARLSYAVSAATLQTQLQALFGNPVSVSISSNGGGTNNRVNVSGMTLPIGTTTFKIPVRVDANNFPVSATITEQAYLEGLTTQLGGPKEASNEPSTFNPKDGTPMVVTLSGTRCLPPVADNFTNQPIPQGAAATAIPPVTAGDPDGFISSYRITSVPTASTGVLSVSCPLTPSGATCIGNFANLTAAVLAANPGGILLSPAQAGTLRFDPAPGNTTEGNFTFTATDNSGNVSNVATYRLPVSGQSPVSNNIMAVAMVNTAGPSAIQPLSSADPDGSIATYQLTALPNTTAGVLSVDCSVTPVTGASCVGGRANLTAAVLTANSGAVALTPQQITSLQFDPTAGYTGNAQFNYNAVDNNGNVSNGANYTIPVVAVPTTTLPPLADNITAQPVNNSLGPVAVPPLKARDLDNDEIISYTITALDGISEGILSVDCSVTPVPNATCTGGRANLTPAVLAANGGAIILTPQQILTLRFDPTAAFKGTYNLSYYATDDDNYQSNTALYSIPVINTPPVAVNIHTVVPYNGPAAAIIPLTGSDLDGTISGFRLKSAPVAAQGVLSVPCPLTGATCVGGFAEISPSLITGNGLELTPAQAAGIRFDPAAGYSGTFGFNYSTVDNDGLESQAAVYTITIANQPPVSNDITVPVIANSAGATTITALSSSDPDGTITGYSIFTLPPEITGELSISCPPAIGAAANCVGGRQVLTQALLDAFFPNGLPLNTTQFNSLRFDPADSYTGIANFTYNATDNSGNASNVANYNIPISGVGNLPPVAKNLVNTSMPNINGVTDIVDLSGSDPDGTVTNYVLTTLPDVQAGILSVPCPVSGVSPCTGFADLTAAVLAANPQGIALTPAQAQALRFDPSGAVAYTTTFNYFVTDNVGNLSNTATITIPITGSSPVVAPIVAPTIPQTSGPVATGITPAGSDADGSIVSYQIETIPPAGQGVLSVPCLPTPSGATCINNFATLTAAVLASNAGSITLTPTQMAGIRFDPSGSYTGNVLFNFHATDNTGLTSNSAKYTIPVSSLPPLVSDVTGPNLQNTATATVIPTLSGTDPDGTVSTYYLNSIPPAAQGVLSVACPFTAIGVNCTSGTVNLTAAILSSNPGGIPLTPAQAAALQFDPAAGFSGAVLFNYSAADATGQLSNLATYTIPVNPPVVLPIAKLQLTALRQGSDILLNWTAEGETALSHYEVEWSLDGSRYSFAAKLPARNQPISRYAHTMYNYTAPLYYLRLKVVNADGRYTYSPVVIVRLQNTTDISAFPNPAHDWVVITGLSAGMTAELSDALGHRLRVQQVNGPTLTLNTAQLPAGLYQVQLRSRNKEIVSVLKLIKN